ncbi:MAG: DUF4194 domain-containing protein [Sphaerochaetaceae bacterium]|nr:DUF4194 domain-containing protein [Sphaerochaetaceae bacterium]
MIDNLENNNSKEWGEVCVKLLMGPLFKDENEELFEKLDLWFKEVNAYFNIIGLKINYSKEQNYAFLEPNEDEEGNVISNDRLSRLLIKHPLTYETSLVLVILREELDKFEIDDTSSDLFILKESEIAELVEPYYRDTSDKVKYNDLIASQLTIIKNMGLIKQIRSNGATSNISEDRVFIIRNIIRAKVNVAFLKEFKERLAELQGEKE